MKIAHVIPTLGFGGAERVAIELARCAALAGHEVTIFVGWEDGQQEFVRARLPEPVAIRAILQANRTRTGRYRAGFAWVRSHRRELSTFDIVHCHLTFGAFIGSLLFWYRKLSRGRKPRIVETYHAVGMRIPALKRWIHGRMALRRDALVLMASDPYWKRLVERHPRLLVRTIKNGAIDPQGNAGLSFTKEQERARLGIPAGTRLVVGTVGVLRVDRQPWLYVPIFSNLARLFGPAIHFVFGGGGPEQDRLEALLRAEGLLDRSHITGPISEPRRVMAAMDLYLTINVGPYCGVAAMEAALSGVPVMAIQLLKTYRATDDDWIWSSSDVGEISARAAELLRDETARVELGRRQQSYARQNHTVDQMCKSYQELYSLVLERSGSIARSESR